MKQMIKYEKILGFNSKKWKYNIHKVKSLSPFPKC